MTNNSYKCPKCNVDLILCPATWPWNPEFWICPECDGTFCYMGNENDK